MLTTSCYTRGKTLQDIYKYIYMYVYKYMYIKCMYVYIYYYYYSKLIISIITYIYSTHI